MNKLNLIGNKYGKLTVLRENGRTKNGAVIWECSCICGSLVSYSSSGLISGRSKSCGCSRIKHGMSRSREYCTWVDIKQRCFNSKNKYYKDYGARGIYLCKRWLKFENFLEDMGKKPTGRSIDRIDNNDGYTPKNCRWATTKQQSINKRNTVRIMHKGVEYTLQDLSLLLGVNRSTLYDRYYRKLRYTRK